MRQKRAQCLKGYCLNYKKIRRFRCVKLKCFTLIYSQLIVYHRGKKNTKPTARQRFTFFIISFETWTRVKFCIVDHMHITTFSVIKYRGKP